MLKRGTIILAVGALAILGACGSQDDEPEPTVTRIPDAANAPVIVSATATGAASSEAASPAATSPAAASPGVTEPAAPTTVEVDMVDIAFDPKELTIAANTDVTVNLVNSGAATHNFTIESQGISSGDYVAGQTGTLTLNLPPGDYEYICTIPGHKEAGMVGTLHVVAGGAAASEPAASEIAASPTTGTVASPVASPAASPAASPEVSAVVPVGDAERGRAAAAVCLGCHTVTGTTSVGPTWKGLYGSQVTLESGETVTADDAYLHESIVDPNAQIVEGFPPAMPAFNYLPEDQIADLIAYIKSLEE